MLIFSKFQLQPFTTSGGGTFSTAIMGSGNVNPFTGNFPVPTTANFAEINAQIAADMAAMFSGHSSGQGGLPRNPFGGQ